MILTLGTLSIAASEGSKTRERTWAEWWAGEPGPSLLPKPGIGSDLGEKFGKEFGSAAVAMVIAAGGKAAAAGKAAATAVVATATSPAAMGVGAGVVVTYGGYKTYRYFYPTDKTKAEIAEQQRKQQVDLQTAEIVKCQRDRAKLSKDFTSCIKKNRLSQDLTQHGYPVQCQDEAHALALEEGGDEEVLRVGKKHQLFTPSWERRGSK